MIRSLLAALCALLLLIAPGVAVAQSYAGVARLAPDGVQLARVGDGVDLTVSLTRPVPWRVYTMDVPRRLVVDLRAVDAGSVAAEDLSRIPGIAAVRAGPFRGGWWRLVADLDAPLGVVEAGMETGHTASDGAGAAEGATVRIALRPVSPETYAAQAGAPDASPAFAPEPRTMGPPPRRDPGQAGLVVVLDPGHGGVDPGAVRDGVHEADITLAFARLLRDALRRRGFEVALTREADVFVSLDGRIAAARRADADVFFSIHADAIPEGIARGAQVWTLSEEASSRAGALLAERHNRSDLLAGLDLSGQDDQVARLLMDLARQETAPRTDALADALVAGLQAGGVRLHTRPREEAAFAVLRAPDIPSVLVELGFMSSPGELEKLQSPAWRARAVAALADGLVAWRAEDAARAPLNRR